MSVTFPLGFRATGIASGIKENGNLDLAVIAAQTQEPCVCAATFTKNLAAAAPVLLSKANILASGGRAGAVLLSSGNANAATGKKGDQDALASITSLSNELGLDPCQVLVGSTGLIGIPMPITRLLNAIPEAAKNLLQDESGGLLAAQAIMTTDTFPKLAKFEHKGVKFGGIAKGAAMISPNMATMLAVITCDAATDHQMLSRVLLRAVDESFNRITIDGCTSTNDSVFVMASGLSEISLSEDDLFIGMQAICNDLAGQIVFDAEGASKLIKVQVLGASTEQDALIVARKIANSSLVKCSFFGRDPYWGRVLSEVGSSGVNLDINRVSISYGEMLVYQNREEVTVDKAALNQIMQEREVRLLVDLALGDCGALITTADLTPAYIAENMRTS